MAFHDLAMRFSDSLLRPFYRGRLGFPRTKDQKLLKTKDVAVCDRRIGVGPTAPWQEFSNWCERDPISPDLPRSPRDRELSPIFPE